MKNLENHTSPATSTSPAYAKARLAMLVWLAIWPSATAIALVLRPLSQAWPIPLQTLATTLLLVPWMVYAVMPFVQRLLARPQPFSSAANSSAAAIVKK